MAPTTTARDVCRHCGNEWRPGWERCRRCGATLRNRITAKGEAPDDSGLELDRRRRTRSKETTTARVPRVEQSEAPTRELSPEARPPADPSTRISVIQVLTGALGVALLAQLLAPSVLPTLTALVVHT